VTHFGGSPKLFGACMSAGIAPINGLAAAASTTTSSSSGCSKLLQLDALRCVLSTGAPLLPEHFSWIYNSCKVRCNSQNSSCTDAQQCQH
jgi:acyl-coenzyme A synthetase/AMP-(fatty) acid ligase